MRILIDMNLSPDWVAIFKAESWEASHWNEVGDPKASDVEILTWARTNQFVVFTHDLDFGALLAVSGSRAPSVIQLRSQETSPAKMGAMVVHALKQLAHDLEVGVLVTLDPARSRARILPLR